MQPAISNVIKVSTRYLHKIVLYLGLGAHIKGQDKLLEQLIMAAKRQNQIDKGSAVELILNQNNGNNDILATAPTRAEIKDFLFSKCGYWIQNNFKF